MSKASRERERIRNEKYFSGLIFDNNSNIKKYLNMMWNAAISAGAVSYRVRRNEKGQVIFVRFLDKNDEEVGVLDLMDLY